MANNADLHALIGELPSFNERVEALRVARLNQQSDPGDMLEATLLELELAQEELRVCHEELTASGPERTSDIERELLRQVLHVLTAPVAVLDHTGRIQSANPAAIAALSVPSGLLPGRLFVTFVDLSSRTVFRTRFAAARRDHSSMSFGTRLIRAGSIVPARLTLTGVTGPSVSRPQVIVQLGSPEPDTPGTPAEPWASADPLPVAETTPRRDLMPAMARLLIGDEFMSETALLTQAAQLMTADFADWVVADMVREGGLRRVAVEGAHDAAGRAGVRLLERQDPVDSRLPLHVAQTGTAVLQPLIEDETDLGKGADGLSIAAFLGVGSLLVVPIRTGDRSEGALTLIRRAGRRWFTPADRTVAEEIGEQLAIALRSALNRRRSLVVSRTLQRSLLPAALPAIPGVETATTYAPATTDLVQLLDVGGDFFDVFESRSGWGFVLGDVCGRGERAAAVTAAVRHGTRVLGYATDRPGDILRQVNEAMFAATEDERFVTTVAGHLRWAGASVQVRLANAGHPPAAVLRADGSVEFTPGGGLPLGAFAHIEPEQTDLCLNEGDMLLLYTDGVTEARDPSGRFYTDARLTEALLRGAGLSAAELVRSIELDVGVFTSGGNRDDLALLALRVTGDPALSAHHRSSQ